MGAHIFEWGGGGGWREVVLFYFSEIMANKIINNMTKVNM